MDGVVSAGVKNEDEGLYPVQHGYWLQVMREAVAAAGSGQQPGTPGPPTDRAGDA